MIACVHQPNYLPWLGFFAKIAASDAYVVMDNVQFPRNSWVNRVRIGGNGPPVWLTVPVRHSGLLNVRIADVEISWEHDWNRKQLTTIRQRYARSPFLEPVLGSIEEIFARRHRRLADQNLELIESMLMLCGIDRPLIRGSSMSAEGSNSELIVAMCRETGATEYLAGKGAAAYEDLGLYAEAGIAYRKQDFVHPEYPQRGHSAFEAGLSIIDALLSVGPEKTREL
ncbi:MAG TPA: WbqC family protein, partial [Thermoanaerobaculia bacterium]